MAENKRFEFFRGEDRTPMIYDNKMEKYYFCVDLDNLSDLLNEQHETIENLKDANVRCCNEYHYFHKRMMKLENENMQLRLQLQSTSDQREEFYRGARENANMGGQLEKENTELKKENANIISDLDYYRVKSGSCEEGLFQKDKEIARLENENKKLKRGNDLLLDELEQAKAVIHKKWDEYLKKKELI